MNIHPGTVVRFHYTLSINGAVIDSSQGRSPLTYIHGTGQLVPGLEQGLEGLNEGDRRHVTVTPERGYGRRDPGALQKVPKEVFVDIEGLRVGAIVSGRTGDLPFQAVVAEIGDDDVTLDLNHPLAGKTLDFDVEIIEIVDRDS